MIASCLGYDKVVQLLIDAGANKDLQDSVRKLGRVNFCSTASATHGPTIYGSSP